jgi:hypothetical protein
LNGGLEFQAQVDDFEFISLMDEVSKIINKLISEMSNTPLQEIYTENIVLLMKKDYLLYLHDMTDFVEGRRIVIE